MKDLDTTLRQAARGDQDAWRIIVDEFAPRVFAYLRSQCGDGELAEELTQSTFCTVAAKLGGGQGYEEKGKFEAWLFRIAMNRLRDEIRRRKRHAVPTDSDVLGRRVAADDGENINGSAGMGTVVDAEVRVALRQALAELPAADREIIEFRDLAGLSFCQISELLDQPLGTVLARHHRALAKLKAALSGVMESDDR